MSEELILVDEFDKELGSMEKMEAHKKGLLHRAVSVFIFNEKGKLLLQKRAPEKYHSPGLWSNTACSHPMPGEQTREAAKRRLMEEMGLSCELKHAFSFIYKVQFKNGLAEHEFDHVFIGESNETPKPKRTEVIDWAWCEADELNVLMKVNPDMFTEWFKICYERVVEFRSDN